MTLMLGFSAESQAGGKCEEAGGQEERDSWSDGSSMAAASGTLFQNLSRTAPKHTGLFCVARLTRPNKPTLQSPVLGLPCHWALLAQQEISATGTTCALQQQMPH